MQAGSRPNHLGSDLSAERERVLKLLEDGKITAEESTELLSALGETVAPAPASAAVAMTHSRWLALIGAAVVTIGFFMPWFSFDLGKEMHRMMGATELPMPPMNFTQTNQDIQTPNGPLHVQWPGQTGPPQPSTTPFLGFNAGVNVAGGDIANGLGWLILLLAAGAAVLPYVATGVKADVQRNITYAALAVGSLLLIYLLTRSIQNASFGIAVVIAGYVLLWLGTIREYRVFPEPAARVATS